MVRNYYGMIDRESAILLYRFEMARRPAIAIAIAVGLDKGPNDSFVQRQFQYRLGLMSMRAVPFRHKNRPRSAGRWHEEGKMETSKSMSANPVRQHADGEKSKDDRKSEPGVKGVVSAEY
jgi:hypothetical protein